MRIGRSRRIGKPSIAVLLPLLLSAPAFTSPAHASGADSEAPPLVESVAPERPWPVFVAAELAVTPSGAVTEDLFHLGAASAIRNASETLRDPMGGDCFP